MQDLHSTQILIILRYITLALFAGKAQNIYSCTLNYKLSFISFYIAPILHTFLRIFTSYVGYNISLTFHCVKYLRDFAFLFYRISYVKFFMQFLCVAMAVVRLWIVDFFISNFNRSVVIRLKFRFWILRSDGRSAHLRQVLMQVNLVLLHFYMFF